MPTIADYSIIADAWFNEKDTDTVKFSVPANIDPGSRAVLGFMFKVWCDEALSLEVRINGIKVWSWQCDSGDSFPARFFQEVVAAGVVKPGSNVFSFSSSSGSFRSDQFSDVVVWWQAKI